MCDTLRNTLSRGRSVVPMIRLRCRRWIRSLRSAFVWIFITWPRLPGLLLQDLARVANALLLVRIRLAQPPDIRGDLADELPIDARHGDVRLLLDRDVD